MISSLTSLRLWILSDLIDLNYMKCLAWAGHFFFALFYLATHPKGERKVAAMQKTHPKGERKVAAMQKTHPKGERGGSDKQIESQL